MSQLPYQPPPSQPTPEQRLLLMDDTKWEIFIEQCAMQLRTENHYSQVVRIGGAGDKGRDVCGYTIYPAINDSWDLYQAKFYSGTLSPSEFAPELAKFLSCVFDKEYTRPKNYFVCALRIGPKLHDLVINPESLKSYLLEEWKKKNGIFGNFVRVLSLELENFIDTFPFDVIKVKTASDLLEIHSRSSKHWEMFGVLAHRGANPDVPDVPTMEEQQYVEALLDIYKESESISTLEASHIPAKYLKHFKAQRQLFFSAEGLNRFSRDKLPGAFDDLLGQVNIGVGSELTFPHPNGLTRLSSVLRVANTLQVSSNPLNERLHAGDLQGTCHHLANQKKITWVDENE